MKTSSSIMRGTAARMLVLATLILPLGFSACEKDDSSADATVSIEEATEVMVQTIDPASGGLVVQTDYAITVSLDNSSSLSCGVRKDSTINKQAATSTRSYSYNLAWSRWLTCVGPVPSKYEHTFNGASSYVAPRMSSNDNSQGAFTVTGLEPSSAQLTVDQTYTRTGTQQSSVRNNRSFSSTVTIQVSGLKADKASRQILSGTAAVTVKGTASTGESFSYSGTLTFLGNKKATLSISGGSTITIQW